MLDKHRPYSFRLPILLCSLRIVFLILVLYSLVPVAIRILYVDDEFRSRPDFSGFRTRTRKQPIRYPTPTVFDRLEVVPHASQARDAHDAHETIPKTRRRSENELI